MKEFWIASTVSVAVMIISYPFMGRAPQAVPQEQIAEGVPGKASDRQTAEATPEKTPDKQTAESAPERGPGNDVAEIPQERTADTSENKQPVVSEQPAVVEQPVVAEAPPVSQRPHAVAVNVPIENNYPDSMPLKPDLSYLAYYAYSEVPPDTKPADTILQALKEIPPGTPLDEIDLAATALGLDTGFMKAVARIESDFDPKQRTGSYIGLFQLSNYEFAKYGSGDITNARDNAVAASYKFATAAILFEISTHKKPTISDLYLIHQQGTQGAAEHVSHPERIAWKSMCATDEGRVKGEKWCKRAIWQNTLPSIKALWKSVDNLTSGAFVEMWQQRVDAFYARYSQALAQK